MDITRVAEAMTKLGIEHVHVAVRPVLDENGSDYLKAVQQQDWAISSTMIDFPQEDYSTLESIRVTGGIAPDEYWGRNRKLFTGAVEATEQLGVKHVSMHAGFIDTTQAEYVRKFHDRIRRLADAAAAKQIVLLMETGQESAEELREFLQDLNHPAVGVNFDPANMILYNKDAPGEAVRILAPWIRHIHIKDAIRTKRAGTWGTEVRWGEGQVGGDSFLKALEEIGYDGALAIEREAGDDRVGDIELAAQRLGRFKKQS
jgi:sugar phosphate isomerase/epimerase